MIGVLLTAIFCLGAVGIGYSALRHWLVHFDSRAKFGLSGIIGLGLLGTLTFFLGLLPGGFKWGLSVIAFLVVIGLFTVFKHRRDLTLFHRKPQGLEILGVVAPLLLALIPLVGVLAPSTAQDWDSIAYHLAVPKLWIEAGRITEISFIHHSNFPFTVDNLFVWGLQWGGQAGAKAFMLGFYLLGALTLFGLGRMRGSAAAGLWAAVAFCSVPSILWEAGTAYIDVAHGLYAGLGAWLVLGPDRSIKGAAWVGAILLGLAAGSKYTGLQTLLAVAAVLPFMGPLGLAERLKQGVLVGALACAVAAPWYVKNAITVGNPVYPFFYEKLGGKNWDQHQADVYRNEQKTFGVPNEGALTPAHAILGLAYQPGRYTNPAPKLVLSPAGVGGALGDPMGACGFALIVALLIGLARARQNQAAGPLAFVMLSLLMWLALSQQSRYIIGLAPILALVLGIEASRKDASSRILAGCAVAQVAISLWIMQTLWLTPPRVAAATGGLTAKEFVNRFVPFSRAAEVIDGDSEVKRVALYDEVFGFYVNKPYYWASYGHSTEMGYAEMKSPEDLLAAWKRMGFTHVYVNLAMSDQAFVRDQWTPAMGLAVTPEGWQSVPPIALPEEVRKGLAADVQVRWKPFLAELVARGDLQMRPVPSRNGLLFAIVGQ